jgi:ABC-type transport system substrate-binding protein
MFYVEKVSEYKNKPYTKKITLHSFRKNNYTPYIEKLIIYLYTNEDLLLKDFKSGSLDIAGGVSKKEATKLKATNTLTAPLTRNIHLFLNNGSSPLFSQPEIREVLYTILTQEKKSHNLSSSSGSPLYSILGFNEVLNTNKSNAEIQNILEKNGWKKEETTYTKKINESVLPFSFTITTPNIPEMVDLARNIQSVLSKYDIGTQIKTLDQTTLLTNTIQDRKYDALLFGYTIQKPKDIEAFWHSKERHAPGLNISLYANSKVDEKIEALQNSDENTQKILAKEIDSILQEEHVLIPLIQPDYVFITKKSLGKIDLPQLILSSGDRYRDIKNWYKYTDRINKLLLSKPVILQKL